MYVLEHEYLPYDDPQRGQIWEPYMDVPYQWVRDKPGYPKLKAFLVQMVLRMRIDASNEIRMSLNQVMEECGYKPGHGEKKIKPFRDALADFMSRKGVSSDVTDWSKVTPAQIWTIRVEKLEMPWNVISGKSQFVVLRAHEFEKVIAAKDVTGITTAALIGVYLLIKSYSCPAYPGAKKIADLLGLSDKTVRRAIDVLVDIGLIRRQRFMVEVEDGTWQDTVSAYTCDQDQYFYNPENVEATANMLSERLYGGRTVRAKGDKNKETDDQKFMAEIYEQAFAKLDDEPEPQEHRAFAWADKYVHHDNNPYIKKHDISQFIDPN